MKARSVLIALAGGSGAGKTWLADRLQATLPVPATRISLDDFYLDQSHLPRRLRDRVNFDHPRAIDWRLAEAVLRACRDGCDVQLPRYSFRTHARLKNSKVLTPKAVILVDGLWLLRRPRLRRLFDLRIFVHCPGRLRLQRRLERDLAGRGRDEVSVRRQFQETVAPMHGRFVAPQAVWADLILRQPVDHKKVARLAGRIENLLRQR
ncbi:MAG: uridine kinase [Limisphaerales bacterium]